MTETLKFIHAADLHLGAPFRGLQEVSEKWANRLIDAIPEAFERMIQAALSNEVDFVVIAGDSFDLGRPSYDEYMRFIDGMERLNQAGIPVYLVAGNHDPLTSWQDRFASLPSNTHMFPASDPGFVAFERDGQPLCLIGGRSYHHLTWPQDEDIARGITRAAAERALGVRAPFAIGIIHSGLDVDPYKAPTNPKNLLNAGMDYWALGHIHSPRMDSKKNPRVCFSGCIQGRAIKEAGPHGVSLVTLTQGKPNQVEFIPTASVAWAKFKVDISKAQSISQIAEMVIARSYEENGESGCSQMVERVTLSGATPMHALLQRPDVLEGLRRRINEEAPHFFCDVIVDKTKAPLNRKALKKEGLFPATLLAISDAAQDNLADDMAFLQNAFIEKGITLTSISEKKLARMAEEAEALVFDALGGEE